ncbi:uncharacterized protein LOC130707699 [Balaenoptera acutorostrata]|uniref:Uncharacterized protein LOC130707699 n=1 Tax=Balaenoptera acutorostrata TaxID=9767 RepID=A0ABM3TDK6_BALAC|nr:uncharacterized protein LOC130707699 [Balaenoptera acutorostrata]
MDMETTQGPPELHQRRIALKKNWPVLLGQSSRSNSGAAMSFLGGSGSRAERKASPAGAVGRAPVPPWRHLATHPSRGHCGPWSPQDAGAGLTTLACPQCPTGWRETARTKSEVCNMLCTTHALPQNVIIFATIYEQEEGKPAWDRDTGPASGGRGAWGRQPHTSELLPRLGPGIRGESSTKMEMGLQFSAQLRPASVAIEPPNF